MQWLTATKFSWHGAQHKDTLPGAISHQNNMHTKEQQVIIAYNVLTHGAAEQARLSDFSHESAALVQKPWALPAEKVTQNQMRVEKNSLAPMWDFFLPSQWIYLKWVNIVADDGITVGFLQNILPAFTTAIENEQVKYAFSCSPSMCCSPSLSYSPSWSLERHSIVLWGSSPVLLLNWCN